MEVTVLGAGAIGSLVGARLQEAGTSVTLVGRQAHVDAVGANGLLVRSLDGERRVQLATSTQLAGSPDIILLTVKSQDVVEACREIARVPSEATVVTMQNGVRSDAEAADVLGRRRVVGCVMNISATYLEPGVVEQNTPGRFQVGAPFPEASDRVPAVADLLSKAFRTEVVPDIARARWTKLMSNVNNAIMAITDLPIGKALRDRGLARLAVATIRESVKTVQLAGHGLDQSSRARTFRSMSLLPQPIANLVFAPRLARDFPPDSQFGPSTLQSLRRGSSSELDYLNGEIVRLGREIGRPTPYNSGLLEAGREVFASRRPLTPEELLRRFAF
jgi:2-dehydropantoate 2-reductase